MNRSQMNREYGFIDNYSNNSVIVQKKGQYISGYSIGILHLDNCWYPVIPGNVANLCTYDYPVRLKKVPNSNTSRILNGDPQMLDDVIKAARELEEEGARAISSACGFFGNYQEKVSASVDIPVYLSSIIQVPWIYTGLKPNEKVGILTAYEAGMTPELFESCGINDSSRCVIKDLSNYPEFSAIIENRGSFDNEKVKQEVVDAAKKMVNNYPEIGAILLECSDIPPYASDIQRDVKLPVFDFISLINWIHHATAQTPYFGFL
ncbi:aspartate/glutamate racemase family protein [Lentibacillus cibarius]|uniref:Aspartate/glutamate racemase family protein n=1 Tax=Lentibacillus cibarius TaxID=2583219 RepID=A0A549YJN7_9BACI|nr:aspartate/glutamate racemase family protein [Lentibacillus cibarius]TRM12106.1 aspartate/glutamate racemase family protein [Lentibacillus cibarius]